MHPDAPWLEYGYEEPFTELDFWLPSPPWAIADESPGGWDISAGDVEESFEITYRHIREVRLLFRESQEAAVRAWYRWAISAGTAFNFKFRKSDAAARSVFLHSPVREFKPERDEEFKGLLSLTVKLRTADGEPFTGAWTTY